MACKRLMYAGLAATLLLGASPARGQGEDARRRLAEEALDKKTAASRSRHYFEAGKRLYSEMLYVKARDALQRAVALDHTNSDAAALLEKVNDVLHVRMPSIRTSLQDLALEKRVRIQERLVALENALRGAREALEKATEPPPEDQRGIRTLADQIRWADRAVMHAERAREIVKWMPSEVDTKQQEERADVIVAEAREIRARKLAELRQEKTRRSIERLEQQKIEEEKLEQHKIAKLLDQVQMLFDNERFDQSEELAEEVLRLDPPNSRARELWGASREQQHLKRELELRRTRKEEKLRLDEDLAEAGIPYSDLLVYPPDWREITTRESVEAAEAAEPQWKREVRRKLDRKVTFEFVDTPLSEAIQFLQTLTETTIILDSKAFDGAVGTTTPITLKVTKMPLRTALRWILRLADLDYTLKNEAVFISTPRNLAGEVDLKIYDVRDLTHTITSFPGPELILTGTGAGVGGGAGPIAIDAPPPESLVAAGSLGELIMSRVAPSSWGADLGTSLEERSGKLVVMQKPEVHRLITQLLRTFRETQTLQVAVQARFIEVRDSFLEDIGVQFADLPGHDPTILPPVDNSLTWSDVWPQLPATHPAAGLPSALNDNHPFASAEDGDDVGLLYSSVKSGPASEYDYWMRSTAFTNRISPLGTRLGSVQNTPAGSGQGLTFQFRFIGNVLAQAILHALKKEEKGDLLLAPRITMYNNQRAYIMAAMQRAYISDYDISGSSYDPIIATIMEGTVLDVRPTVSHDRRYITMNFEPGTADNLQFDIRNLVGTGFDLPIYLPSIRFRSVRTTIMVPDGGTVLVSGLMTDAKFDASSGIPFFSDLPIVGRLFGTDLKQREKVNLLIMCSANLILFEEEEAKQL